MTPRFRSSHGRRRICRWYTSAEAVLRLRPDLILAAPFGAQTTLALLEQEGVPVLRIDLPRDFDGIRQQTRTLASALGVSQRGDALLAAMDATLDALPHPDHPVRALSLGAARTDRGTRHTDGRRCCTRSV